MFTLQMYTVKCVYVYNVDDDGDDDDDDDDDEPDLRIINTWLNCINVVQPPLFSMNWNKSARFSY